MKRLLLLLLFAAPLAAQEPALKISCHEVEPARCAKLIDKIQPELSKFPIQDWRWIILGGDSWRKLTESLNAPESAHSTIGIVEAKRMYLRADWLSNAGFREMLSVLAHEYGHVSCGTKKESQADACAARFLASLGYNWNVRKHLASIH